MNPLLKLYIDARRPLASGREFGSRTYVKNMKRAICLY